MTPTASPGPAYTAEALCTLIDMADRLGFTEDVLHWRAELAALRAAHPTDTNGAP